MNLFSRFFGKKYNDEQIMSHAKNAVAEDPLLNDAETVTVTSAKGVVTLMGSVHRTEERDRVEGVVRNVIRTVGLEYDQIVNELKVG